jgi:hypothetical protein
MLKRIQVLKKYGFSRQLYNTSLRGFSSNQPINPDQKEMKSSEFNTYNEFPEIIENAQKCKKARLII